MQTLAIIWNPWEGIDLGPITIRFYSLMFVFAFLLGLFITRKIFERENEPVEKVDTLLIWVVVATLIGARLGHCLFYDYDYYKNNILEIFLPVKFEPEFRFTGFQGLASHGTAIGIITAIYFFCKKVLKRPFLWLLDRVTLCIASGGVFIRLGNFFNSEIIGHKTDSLLGIRFLHDQISKSEAVNLTGITNPHDAYVAIATEPKFASILEQVPARHPTQLYEAFCYIIVFAALYFLYWKTDVRNKQGFLFGVFMVSLWSIRFAIEFLKESQGGFEEELGIFSTGQWLSIPFIIIGIYLLFRVRKQKV